MNAEIYFTDGGASQKVNPTQGYTQFFSGDSHIGFSNDQLEEDEGELILSVSGVRISTIKTQGLKIPQTVIIDLPPRTELTISRNAVKVTGSVMLPNGQRKKGLIDDLKELLVSVGSKGDLSIQERLSLMSALNFLMKDLQKRNDSLLGEDNLEYAVKNAVQSIASTLQNEGKILLPNIAALKTASEQENVILLDPDLFNTVMTDNKILQTFKSKRLVIAKEIRMFMLDFQSLGPEFADRKFIFDRESKMIFLNKGHFVDPEDPLQLEEIKTLLSEPIHVLTGAKTDLFSETAEYKMKPLGLRKEASTQRKESRDRFIKIVIARELSDSLVHYILGGRMESIRAKPAGVPSAQEYFLLKENEKVISKVLKEYFQEMDPLLIDSVVEELLENIMVALHQQKLTDAQIWSVMDALSRFEEFHKEALQNENYVSHLEKIKFYNGAIFQDVEDDVFEKLSGRIGIRGVANAFAWNIKEYLNRSSGLLGVFTEQHVKDSVVDAFLWLEYNARDSQSKQQLIEILHFIIRALDEQKNDQIFVTLKETGETIANMGREDELLRSAGISEDVIAKYFQTKIAFIKENLTLNHDDQKKRLDNFNALFSGTVTEYMENHRSVEELTEFVNQLIEFIGYWKDYTKESVDQRLVNQRWGRDLRLNSWHLANLDVLNRILKSGNLELFFNVVNFTDQLLLLAGASKYNKKAVLTDLTLEEVGQRLRSLVEYYLSQGNSAEFFSTMKHMQQFMDARSAQFQKQRGGSLPEIDINSTQKELRHCFIYVFGKRDRVAKIEQSGRTNIAQPQYSHSVRLSQFYQYYRQNPDAQLDVSFNDIADFLQRMTQEPITDLERVVIARRINQAIQHVSPDTYIFLREMLQNSRDAVHDNPEAEKYFDVRFYEDPSGERGALYVSMADYVGMSFNIVKNFLFVPGSSSKRGREDLIGQYGTGFYTILRDAKEVLIKTSLGNGEVLYMRLTPIVNPETNEIMDVQIEIEPRQESGFKGTEIQQVRKADFPEMVSAFVESRLISYGGVIDPQEIQVRVSGKNVNVTEKKLLAQTDTPYGPIHIYHLPGENTLTQQGLYMNQIGDEYGVWMGSGGLEMIRRYLFKAGVVVDLPPKLRLIKDRSDIKDRRRILVEIGPLLQLASVNALMKLFLEQQIDLPEIPYDVFYRGGDIRIDESIKQDALDIANGKTLDHDALKKYEDKKENIPLLLISIPLFSYQGQLRSILDFVKLFLTGAITEEELPIAIRKILSEEVVNKYKAQAEQKTLDIEQFGSYSAGFLGQQEEATIVNDIGLIPFNSQEEAHRGFEGYFALAELSDRVGGLINGTPFTTRFYARPDGSAAHAGRGTVGFSWNLYAMDGLIKKITNMLEAPGDELPGLYEVLKIIVHEVAHIREGGTTTHHVQFYEVQLDNMARLLSEETAFRNFLIGLKQKYNGRLSEQKIMKEFAKFITSKVFAQAVEDGNLIPREGSAQESEKVPAFEDLSDRDGGAYIAIAIDAINATDLPDDMLTKDPNTGQIVGQLFLSTYGDVAEVLWRYGTQNNLTGEQILVAYKREVSIQMERSTQNVVRDRKWIAECLTNAAKNLENGNIIMTQDITMPQTADSAMLTRNPVSRRDFLKSFSKATALGIVAAGLPGELLAADIPETKPRKAYLLFHNHLHPELVQPYYEILSDTTMAFALSLIKRGTAEGKEDFRREHGVTPEEYSKKYWSKISVIHGDKDNQLQISNYKKEVSAIKKTIDEKKVKKIGLEYTEKELQKQVGSLKIVKDVINLIFRDSDERQKQGDELFLLLAGPEFYLFLNGDPSLKEVKFIGLESEKIKDEGYRLAAAFEKKDKELSTKIPETIYLQWLMLKEEIGKSHDRFPSDYEIDEKLTKLFGKNSEARRTAETAIEVMRMFYQNAAQRDKEAVSQLLEKTEKAEAVLIIRGQEHKPAMNKAIEERKKTDLIESEELKIGAASLGIGDRAMIGKDVGGIDFNPNKIDLKIKNNGEEIKFNFNPQQFENMQIDGFVPTIIQIIPINNVQFFLSGESSSVENQLSMVK